MSEILITGIEMPNDGQTLHLGIISDGRVATTSGCDSKYKAIKVPPHGRLVDIDASRDDFMQTVYSELYSDGDNYRANRIIDAYDDAQTVIGASTDDTEERE